MIRLEKTFPVWSAARKVKDIRLPYKSNVWRLMDLAMFLEKMPRYERGTS